ncbi:Rz1-like lysis system protein LysC [Caviibacterium pharyngocola]|uniref:Rz1-like lysis system protein LysC n=1 Tax=Caviibacterium pharyngocola TaxID=28159 RepID=UPI001FAEE391|nr:Rz1-like lysis system protein LysC [Caviibacterium pharyngocola]
MLAGCSTSEKVRMITPLPLLCPTDQLCQIPTLNIKTNGDLVTALDSSLNALERCALKERALTDCIDNYNRTLQEKKE